MFVNVSTEKDSQEIHILQSLREGEIYAFEYLFAKYSKTLFHFALKILKSQPEAEEIVQLVFLKIWEKRKSIDPQQKFDSYLFTVALNDIRKSFLNKAKEDKFKVDLYDVLLEQSQEDQQEKDFSRYLKILDEQVEKLPGKRKEIFILHKKEGLTVNEVADYLKLSPKTVENQITAAIKTIREAFHERNITTLFLLAVRNIGLRFT
jgi:RNA polymerase sigma-70 factor (ECF subfamily)